MRALSWRVLPVAVSEQGKNVGRKVFIRICILLVISLVLASASGCTDKKARGEAIAFLRDFNAQCQVLRKEVWTIPMGGIEAIATTDKFWPGVASLDAIWQRHPSSLDKTKYGDDIASTLGIAEELYQKIKKGQSDQQAGRGGGRNEWLALMDSLNNAMAKLDN